MCKWEHRSKRYVLLLKENQDSYFVFFFYACSCCYIFSICFLNNFSISLLPRNLLKKILIFLIFIYTLIHTNSHSQSLYKFAKKKKIFVLAFNTHKHRHTYNPYASAHIYGRMTHENIERKKFINFSMLSNYCLTNNMLLLLLFLFLVFFFIF